MEMYKHRMNEVANAWYIEIFIQFNVTSNERLVRIQIRNKYLLAAFASAQYWMNNDRI